MALQIGDIGFGIEANNEDLQASIKLLRTFQKRVDDAADSVDEFGLSTVNALSKQESALKRALQQTLNLQRALKTGGAPAAEINRVTQAYARLSKELTSGRLSTVEYTRAVDAFNARINRASRELKNVRAARANKEVGGLVGRVRDLQSASVLAFGPLSGLGARITAIGSIANRETLQLAAFTAGVVGAGVAVVTLGKQMLVAGQQMGQIRSVLSVVADDSAEVARELRFVERTANDLGLELGTLAKQYAQIAVASKDTALEGEGVRKIFRGIAEAGAALKLSNEQVEGAFRAVQQIISKGNVQAEELRGQFAERVVGGFQLAAQAMNLTTAELSKFLKEGRITADVLLPHLAKTLSDTFGKQALQNINTLTGAQNALSNQLLVYFDRLDKTLGVTETSVKATRALAGAVEWLNDNLNASIAVVGAVAAGLTAMAAPAIIRGIIAVAAAVGRMTVAFGALSVAMIANPAGALLATLGRLTLFLGGAAAGFYALRDALDAASESTMGLTDDLLELQKVRLRERVREIRLEIAQLEGVVADFETRSVISRIFGNEQEGRQAQQRINFLREELEGTLEAIDDIEQTGRSAQAGAASRGAELPEVTFGTNEKAQKAIEKKIKSLELEAETYGESAKAITLYKLELEGATQAQLQRAEAALSSVEADKAFEASVKASTEAVKQENAEYQKWLETQEKYLQTVVDVVDENAKYVRELEKLEVLLVQFPQYQEIILERMLQINEAMDEGADEAEKLDRIWSEVGDTMAGAFEDAILNIEDAGEALKQLEKDLVRLITREAVTKPLAGAITQGLTSVFGSTEGSTGGGFLSQLFGGIFGGSQTGGFRPANQPRVVGETGPELFIPAVAGRVVPAGQTAAGGGRNVNVVANLNITGVQSPREFELNRSQIVAGLEIELQESVRNL